MLGEKNIRKCIEIFIVGLFFIAYLFLWFKQYTYFNYAGGELYFDDEELIAYASTADEREFNLAPEYSEKVSRIIFWTNKFSEVDIVNESGNTWQFTVSDYYGDEVPSAAEPVILQSGESFSYVADDRGGYVVTVYGSDQDADTDGLCIRYSSQAYMERWKRATVIALGVISAMIILLCFSALTLYRYFNSIAPYVCLGMGAIGFGVSEYAGFIGGEAYLTVLPQIGAFFLGVTAIICAQRQPEQAENVSGKQYCPWVWAIVAAFVAIILHFLMLSAGAGSVWYVFTGGENSGRRILGYIVVFAVFLILFLILGRIQLSGFFLGTIRSYFSGRIAFLSAVLCIFVIARSWIKIHPLFIALFIVIIISLRFGKRIRIPQALRMIYYVMLSALVAVNSCVINFWDTGRWEDVYHTGTFYNTMFFTAAGEPFRGGLNQMYGHFALFYKIPMLIFGNNMRTVGVTTAFFAAVAVFLVLLSVDRILSSDISRLISGMVLIAYLITDYLYLQSFPLRMLWSFVLLYYCVIIKDKKMTMTKRMLGYIICVLAIIWNTESGLVCAVSWAVCIVLHSEKKKSFKMIIRSGLVEILVVIAEVFAAYSTIKLYNICMISDGNALSEFLSWRKEIATLARSDAGDTNNGSLYWVNAPWMYIETALMGCVAVLLDRAGLFGKSRFSSDDLPKALIVFYAAGIFIYWMGRPEEYNIIAPYMGCVVMFVYDRMVAVSKERVKKGTYSYDVSANVWRLTSMVLCLVIAGFLFMLPDVVCYTKRNLADRSIADYGKVKQYLQIFDENVPEEADGEAVGLRMICMSLGRDLESDGLGWGYNEEELEKNCREKEWLILGSEDVGMPFLELDRVIHFGKMDYYLYHNKEFLR